MSTPATSFQPQLKAPIDYLLSALPPLRAAFKVLLDPDPLAAAGRENHSWYGTLIALCLIMTFAMLVILAGDSAPFVNPFTALWTNKFEFNIIPSPNWPVLIRSASFAIFACVFSYIVSCICGKLLNSWAGENDKHAVRLAGYAALAAASGHAAMLLLISAFGWVLYFIKFHIYVLGWMTIASVVLIPCTTWAIAKVFRRTSLVQRMNILLPLAISMTTIMACTCGAIFIMKGLSESLMKQGRTVNNMRSIPTAAVVQTCAKTSADVVCAITLFPRKWQDYELIGEWKLGNVTNPNATHQAHFYWHPAKETDRKFALVTLDSGKEITVEISIEANLVCKADGTNIANDDLFFAMKGRVIGIQKNVSQEIRLRIDNAEPAFVDIMKQVCASQADA